jgi:hypothetical protein
VRRSPNSHAYDEAARPWVTFPMLMREIKQLISAGSNSLYKYGCSSTIPDCCAMDSRYLLALCLLCGLEIACQTFPRLSFGENDDTLPNHDYVDLGMVGTSHTNSVKCHTDLVTCCRSDRGIHRGQWYFPDGGLLQNKSEDGDIDVYEFEAVMRHDLRRRNNATSPTGIYRCEIPTNAVHDDTDISVSVTVYVGLYTSEGKFVS